MEKVKKQKSFGRSYRPVVIWLDELREIVSTLKENAKDVQISTEDYLFTTTEELKEHFASRPQFEMEVTSSGPYARLELTRQWVKLHVSPGPSSAQLFHDIDVVLARRQRSIFYSWWWAVTIFVAGAAARLFPEQAVPITAVQAVIAVWMLWVMFISLRRCAVINLQPRSEARPFFERTKDQLLLLLIGGLMGGLITFAVTVMKERFYPSAPAVTAPSPLQKCGGLTPIFAGDNHHCGPC
jgi:hypothetical protein